MAKSSERANPLRPGQEDDAPCPGDSSDSGSDVTGLDARDVADPQMPVDRAMADAAERSLGTGNAGAEGIDRGGTGTGERRSAGGDGRGGETGDAGVDRVFRPVDAGDDDPLPSDVTGSADQVCADTPDQDGGHGEDESADPVGDGQSDATLAAGLPPQPGRPNPEPDPPDTPSPVSPEDDVPAPDDDHRHHQPGRDPVRSLAQAGRRT